MALTFNKVFARELEIVRQRRLDQWQANQAAACKAESINEQREKSGRERAAIAGNIPPKPDDELEITNGIPESACPDDPDVRAPLIFNTLLDDLRKSPAALNENKGQSERAPWSQIVGDDEPAGPSASHGGGKGSADSCGESACARSTHYGLVGLALSGGGVRSAAFCLGAIQALAKSGVFQKFDYLSTVSGGGFVGSCLSSIYADGRSEFPFMHSPGVSENAALRHLRNHSNYLAPRGFMDYLKAPGILLRGILVNLLVILPYVLLAVIATVLIYGSSIRTAVHANLDLQILAEVTVEAIGQPTQITFFDQQLEQKRTNLAGILEFRGFSGPVVVAGLPEGTKMLMPSTHKLLPDGRWRLSQGAIDDFAVELPDAAPDQFTVTVKMVSEDATPPDAPRLRIWNLAFKETLFLLATLVVILLLYPMGQFYVQYFKLSTWQRRNQGNLFLAFLVAVVGLAAFVEAQPVAIYYSTLSWFGPKLAGIIPTLDVLTGIVAAAAGIFAAFSGRLAKQEHKFVDKALLFAIGLLGPLMLWLVYLMFSRWAICGPPQWSEWFPDTARWAANWFTPEWTGSVVWPEPDLLCLVPASEIDLGQETKNVLWAYFIMAVLVLLYGRRFIDVNRSSLHGYYRDRLSEAYLFRFSHAPSTQGSDTQRLEHNDQQTLHGLRGRPAERGSIKRFIGEMSQKLSALFRKTKQAEDKEPKTDIYVAPYHLINAAVNIQTPRMRFGGNEGQASADRQDERSHDLRGRKADYFLFSQEFVGCGLTGYCRTRYMYKDDRRIDLGTAMAISGAAAAPNMGTSTIKPLVFILSLLNVRLGYWLPNPRIVHLRHEPYEAQTANTGPPGSKAPLRKRIWHWMRSYWYGVRLGYRVGPIYLILEMFGFLHEDGLYINVSDGGHIENLGLYPLLERRCRLIVAVDGARDPKIVDGKRDVNNKDGEYTFDSLATAIRHARIDLGIDINIDLQEIGKVDGRHFAIGRIDYGPDFPRGWLVYIKSSMTEDENPYIREYWLKNPDFPHESTGDQFFEETQFECYRALGSHAARDFLGGTAPNFDEKVYLRNLLRPAKPRA